MDYEARSYDVKRFYELLAGKEFRVGGKRFLSDPDVKNSLPTHGVYFFFEPDEMRTTSGEGLRIVRVGTHGLKNKSKTTLWDRLRAHRGNIKGMLRDGGNHRGSVFRKHIGAALINRDGLIDLAFQNWGRGTSASRQIREQEYPLEHKVSKYIRSLPFLWISVEDSVRLRILKSYIERNAIALLSNFNWPSNLIDPPSASWLGFFSDRDAIRRSGLWNIDYVFDDYELGFINEMERIILNKLRG